MRCDEDALVKQLIERPASPRRTTDQRPRPALIETVRAGQDTGNIDAFAGHLRPLVEGRHRPHVPRQALLLRIPDAETIDRLIHDKIGPADWEAPDRPPRSSSTTSTWGLMLTGRLVTPRRRPAPIPGGVLRKLVARASER